MTTTGTRFLPDVFVLYYWMVRWGGEMSIACGEITRWTVNNSTALYCTTSLSVREILSRVTVHNYYWLYWITYYHNNPKSLLNEWMDWALWVDGPRSQNHTRLSQKYQDNDFGDEPSVSNSNHPLFPTYLWSSNAAATASGTARTGRYEDAACLSVLHRGLGMGWKD